MIEYRRKPPYGGRGFLPGFGLLAASLDDCYQCDDGAHQIDNRGNQASRFFYVIHTLSPPFYVFIILSFLLFVNAYIARKKNSFSKKARIAASSLDS